MKESNYLGMFKGSKMYLFKYSQAISVILILTNRRLYLIGNFTNQSKYQDYKIQLPYTIRDVEEIIKHKGWTRINQKVIDNYRAEDVAEEL